MQITTQKRQSNGQDESQQEWDKNPSLPRVNRDSEKSQSEQQASEAEKSNPKSEALEIVKNGLDELNDALGQGKSQILETYLSFLAKFHNYSVNNSMLIAAQCPHATHVASYDNWKEFGRQVRKGEKGLAIFAPILAKKTVQVEDQNGKQVEREVKKLSGFRIAKVFDVSQTSGDPTPETAKISGDPGQHLSRLETLVEENNIGLKYSYPPDGALGISSGGQIVVRPDLDPPEKFAVLAHELAHELLHKGERRNETNRQVRETEAEAVAFVVSKAFGLDSTTRSSDYISLYRGDSDVLKESLHFIQKTASRIIWGITKDQTRE